MWNGLNITKTSARYKKHLGGAHSVTPEVKEKTPRMVARRIGGTPPR